MNEFRRLYRTQSVSPFVCPSVCLSVSFCPFVCVSVCANSCPAHIFVCYWLTIFGITMRRCVAYIHDPNTTLTFDLYIKFIGFMTWFCVRVIAYLSFDIVILYWTRECITMVRCVAYIHDLCTTLRFDLNIKSIFSP